MFEDMDSNNMAGCPRDERLGVDDILEYEVGLKERVNVRESREGRGDQNASVALALIRRHRIDVGRRVQFAAFLEQSYRTLSQSSHPTILF